MPCNGRHKPRQRSASYRQCDQDETRSLTEAQRHWLVSTHTHSPRFPSTCLSAPYSTQSTRKQRRSIGNESVLEIIINNTINLFSKTAISISLISNHNSFRVLFDNIASVYFIRKIKRLETNVADGTQVTLKLSAKMLYRRSTLPKSRRL